MGSRLFSNTASLIGGREFAQREHRREVADRLGIAEDRIPVRDSLCYDQILDAVWGMDSDIDERTVDVHIRRLRKAVNRAGETDPIRTVRAAGYAMDVA